MSAPVKAGLMIGGAIIVAINLWIYFSPFRSCDGRGREQSSGMLARGAKECCIPGSPTDAVGSL
jgi:hypothetical protein